MDEQQIVDINLAPEIADEPNEESSVASIDIDDDEISIEDDIMNIDDLTYVNEGFDEVENESIASSNYNTDVENPEVQSGGEQSGMNTEDDEESDDDDDNYLQKFDKENKEKYILENHDECVRHNYSEISTMSSVVRNKQNIIIDPFHKTIPILTKYERARILGQRAKQINSGASIFVNMNDSDDMYDGYLIAQKELLEKKIPFIIRRPLPGGGSEYWKLKDLEIIND